jgi:hypothetical protein
MQLVHLLSPIWGEDQRNHAFVPQLPETDEYPEDYDGNKQDYALCTQL